MLSRQSSYSYLGIAILIPLILLSDCGRLGAAPTPTPSATNPSISLSPATFCPGEVLTATWNGGDQPPGCSLSDLDGTCNSYAVQGSYEFLWVERDHGPYNQRGSASAPATNNISLHVNYYVYSPLGEVFEAIAGSTVIKSENLVLRADQGWYCDEETRTYVLSTEGGSNPGLQMGGGNTRIQIVDGPISQCIASTGVCLSPDAFNTQGTPTSRIDRSYRLSVPGGPTVILTPEEPCTDAFMGYHPYDIQISSPDDGPVDFGRPGGGDQDFTGQACDPDAVGEGEPYTEPILLFDIAPGDLCGISQAEGLAPSQGTITDPASFIYGSLPLVGVSRDRCLSSLESDFAASLIAYQNNFILIDPDMGISVPDIGPGNGEDNKSEEDKSEGSVFCGSTCSSNADCAGLGPNPACVEGGFCYDAQTCDTTSSSSGSASGNDNEDDKGTCACSAVCVNIGMSEGGGCTIIGYSDCNGNECTP